MYTQKLVPRFGYPFPTWQGEPLCSSPLHPLKDIESFEEGEEQEQGRSQDDGMDLSR